MVLGLGTGFACSSVKLPVQARKIVGVDDVISRDAADMPEAQVREESVPFKERIMWMILFEGIIQSIAQRCPRFRLQLGQHSPNTVLGLVHGKAQGGGHVGHALASNQNLENSSLEVRQLWGQAGAHRPESLILIPRVRPRFSP